MPEEFVEEHPSRSPSRPEPPQQYVLAINHAFARCGKPLVLANMLVAVTTRENGERMTYYDYNRRVLCPFCCLGELRMVSRTLARCSQCEGAMSHDFYGTFLEIRALTDVQGLHACGCGYPEMRHLPGGVYRCPSCGAEVAAPAG